jgi:LysM repeat protein
MTTRDLVLISTFVNALILGLLLLLTKGEVEVVNLPPVVEKVEKRGVVPKAEVIVAAPPVEEELPSLLPLAPLPPAEEWYTMKSGDNPWKVAKTQKIKFDDLLKLNGLNEERARNLKPGDQIRIR